MSFSNTGNTLIDMHIPHLFYVNITKNVEVCLNRDELTSFPLYMRILNAQKCNMISKRLRKVNLPSVASRKTELSDVPLRLKKYKQVNGISQNSVLDLVVTFEA